jgi:DNA-binding transcriptional regulator/RsmH inhibitor MraZ
MARKADPQALKAELERELHGLQSAWKEIAQKLSLNVRSRFQELETTLREEAEVPPTTRQLKEMLAALQDLKIKPDKARAKDLQRIEKLLDGLFVIYPGREG